MTSRAVSVTARHLFNTMKLDPKTTAFVFPGQGSQALGMGFELAQDYEVAKALYKTADNILKFPISSFCWNGPEELLNDTENTQPALLIHSYAALKVFENYFPHFTPRFMAGHSMGELSALVASIAMSFTDGLTLLRKRGELMKLCGSGSPGGMAAVIGLKITEIDQICKLTSINNEVVQVANDNCPGQVVISGTNDGLNQAIDLALKSGARRAIRLNVSIAAHSALMFSIKDQFKNEIEKISIHNPLVPIIGNVNAKPLTNTDEIKADLTAQLTNRVRWTESIQYMIDRGVTAFIELGSGTVLSGLVKRINDKASCFPLSKPSDYHNLLESLKN